MVTTTREAALSELTAQRQGFKNAAEEYEQMTSDQLQIKTAQWKNRYVTLETQYNGALRAMQSSMSTRDGLLREQLEVQLQAARTEMSQLQTFEESSAQQLHRVLAHERAKHAADMAKSSEVIHHEQAAMGQAVRTLEFDICDRAENVIHQRSLQNDAVP